MENLHLKNLNDDFLMNYRPYAEQKAIELINKAASSGKFIYEDHNSADNILNKIYPSFDIINTEICPFSMHQHVFNIARYLNELSKIQKININKLLLEYLKILKKYDSELKLLLNQHNEKIQTLKIHSNWYQNNIIKVNQQFRINLDKYQKSFFIDSFYFLYDIICENYIKEHKKLTKQLLIFNTYRTQKAKEKYVNDINNIYKKITKNEYYIPISRRKYNEFLEDHREDVINKYCLNILEKYNQV